MDKAYVDFNRLYSIHLKKAFFVVRAKENLKFKNISSAKINKKENVISDQEIELDGFYSKKNYPNRLRRIEYYDLEYDRTFVFLTNNKRLKPQTIAKLYKSRWHVELFFKWIKQHLKIKSFWGQNENAVRIQIWVAISTYLIVAIAKRKLNIQHSLYEILQYITIAPFEKEPLSETFANGKWEEIKDQIDIQLNMF
jgi:IS4 transposase